MIDAPTALRSAGDANQPPPLEPFNPFTADLVLGDAVAREGGTARPGSIPESTG